VLDTNQTKIHYNLLVEKHILTLPLVLYTNELRRTILDYLSHTQNRCSSTQEVCDISMVPTEHLRVLWKRTNPFSSNYKLDTTWQPNTALLNEFDVQIECSTSKVCSALLNSIQQSPKMLDGLVLQYSTQTEKHTSKTVTITGHHLMKTKMFSAVKQLPSAAANNHERYLLVDDINQLATELLTTMELEERTDSDYISQRDQTILIELLKLSLLRNSVVLDGQCWFFAWSNKTDIDGSSNAHANHYSHDWRDALGTFQDDSYPNSNASKTLRITGDDMSIYNADAWRRAVSEGQLSSIDNRNLDNNAQTFDELRQKNFDFYMKNRQFIQFNGEKFIVKPNGTHLPRIVVPRIGPRKKSLNRDHSIIMPLLATI
ncbi:unnamed protein product, partial [Adineta ricciae]